MTHIKNSLLACLTCLCLITNVFAADPMAKEETTPPEAENALSAKDIPPVFYNAEKNKTEQTTKTPGNS